MWLVYKQLIQPNYYKDPKSKWLHLIFFCSLTFWIFVSGDLNNYLWATRIHEWKFCCKIAYSYLLSIIPLRFSSNLITIFSTFVLKTKFLSNLMSYLPRMDVYNLRSKCWWMIGSTKWFRSTSNWLELKWKVKWNEMKAIEKIYYPSTMADGPTDSQRRRRIHSHFYFQSRFSLFYEVVLICQCEGMYVRMFYFVSGCLWKYSCRCNGRYTCIIVYTYNIYTNVIQDIYNTWL